ncbi:beta-N-acetylhexosaminidase [Paenibacillus sp. DS2015]|uniref:beta-N-acetylhexosaminidase n=1 Tax=Paenibacillus sp. DS2015 TaxID=3373917 RepID=UPI003D19E981
MMILLLIAGCSSQAPSPSTTPNQGEAGTTTPETGGNSINHSNGDNVTPIEEEDPITLKMGKMSIEEKVGQMILAGVDGTELDARATQMIAEQKVGGIILYSNNVSDLQGTVQFVKALKQANAGNPVPLFMSVDQEGGQVSRMPKELLSIPSNASVGKTKSADLAETMGKLLARELLLTGFNVNFAPVLDVNSNPNNPVIGDRSFGSSANQVAELGIAEMKGLRSEGVIPVVKHFPGHGDTSVDSHLDLPVVNKSLDQLKKLEWIPFAAAVQEDVEAVMVAHILFPKLDPDKPASLSEVIIGQHLRGELNYQGVVITDDLSMGAIEKNFELNDVTIDTVKAGSDILLVAHSYDSAKLIFDTLLQSVKDGTISESRIDESVYRILSLKSRYNLVDNQEPTGNVQDLNKDIEAWRKQVNAQ